jgi:ABC-type branched-subunit amino acid transport system substrate-binding protein
MVSGISLSAQALTLTPSESAGKRLYREGVSASGEPIMARVGAAGMLLPATSLPCVNCHGRDGIGRPEGGVRPPDLTWTRLSSTYGQQQINGRSYPAYTEGTLARAIQEGRDPGNNRLDPAMPRFVLSMKDQHNLTAYLKRLADDRDPGLDADSLHLGTLLPGTGALSEEGATVAAVLNGCVARINEAGGIHGRQLRLTILDPGPDRASAARAGPVDRQGAGVRADRTAGASAGSGHGSTPGAGRCAPDRAAVVARHDPGQSRDLRAAAGAARTNDCPGQLRHRHLAGVAGPTLIAYPDEPGQRLAAEKLARYLQDNAWEKVRLQAYGATQDDLPLGSRSVFYMGSSGGFSLLAERLQTAGQVPYLFAASNQVAGDLLQVPSGFSRRVFLAYPFVPSDWTRAGRLALTQVRERQKLGGEHAVLQVGAFSSMMLLSEGMKQAGRDASREKLIEALEGLHDFDTGLTPLISFGPGRRQGLSGAHIVTVDLPDQRFSWLPLTNPLPRCLDRRP